MSLPFKLNSRTFVRNIKPLYYPEGTRAGLDWEALGGVYDNMDPRNPIYWGPPFVQNGHMDFGMKAGETPANALRRLKMEGFIGLYCARSEEVKRQEAAPGPARPSGLERIAAAAAESRSRNSIQISRTAAQEGRRPTRRERQDALRRSYRDNPASLPPVPALVGAGDGYLADAEEEDEFDGDEPVSGYFTGNTGNDEADDIQEDGTGDSDESDDETNIDPVNIDPDALPAPPGPASARPDTDSVSRETSAHTFPEEDKPVGGGGQAASVATAPPPAGTPRRPPGRPPREKPAPEPEEGEDSDEPPKPPKRGKGLAGGGARRGTPAPNPEPAGI